MMKISFYVNGRTGNNIFQYMACKIISIFHGHQYVPLDEFAEEERKKCLTIGENDYYQVLLSPPKDIENNHILLQGYFQNSDYYTPYREQLIKLLKDDSNHDYWVNHNGERVYIRNLIYGSRHSLFYLTKDDIVVNLRLDDFIQLPNPTSDVLPPQYYLDILENRYFHRLFIVCDRIQHDWEHKYLKYFDKWNPILLQENIEHDIALMRDAPVLIHSNSTLCWTSSFFAEESKIRYIPKTFHYSSQNLNMIDSKTDILLEVKTLSHYDVFHLNPDNFRNNYIHPLTYSIPDECVLSVEEHEMILNENRKTDVIADIIPNGERKYNFGSHQEKEYNQMYRNSRFAYTKKKGGWDCLRHYEIMANGCIPIFTDIEKCPRDTLVYFPKELIIEANQRLLPFDESKIEEYNKYSRLIMNYIREHCMSSISATKYFLSVLEKHRKLHIHQHYLSHSNVLLRPKKMKNILLVRGNIGVNYTRELLWIGLKTYFSSLDETDGVQCEYPKIDYLYKSYPEENKKDLYGYGFTYSRKLKPERKEFSENEIIEKTKMGFWDLIVFGKVGPDEGWEGSLPQMPLWEYVFKRYSREQIVFLYGGDECIDTTYNNRYKQHIEYHSQFGHCFVRELNR